MNQPGVWIMGAPEDDVRNGGLGIVIEYANQRRQPQWVAPAKPSWDYTIFGKPARRPAAGRALQTIDMVFEKVPRGQGKFNSFTVNGKPYPHDQEFVLKQGTRYRLVFRNRTDDAHPLHLHRHLFELAEIYGKATAGHHQGHGRRAVLRARDRGLRRRSAGADALPLPHPASHGLRLQGAVPLRVSTPIGGSKGPALTYRRYAGRT